MHASEICYAGIHALLPGVYLNGTTVKGNLAVREEVASPTEGIDKSNTCELRSSERF